MVSAGPDVSTGASVVPLGPVVGGAVVPEGPVGTDGPLLPVGRGAVVFELVAPVGVLVAGPGCTVLVAGPLVTVVSVELVPVGPPQSVVQGLDSVPPQAATKRPMSAEAWTVREERKDRNIGRLRIILDSLKDPTLPSKQASSGCLTETVRCYAGRKGSSHIGKRNDCAQQKDMHSLTSKAMNLTFLMKLLTAGKNVDPVPSRESAFFNDAVGIDERSWGIPRLLPGASHMTWLSLPIAVASSGVILSNGVILWSTRRFVLTRLSDVPPAETAVVLGCAAKVNGGPNFYFEARMDAAAELFSCGKVERLLVSGGLGRNGSECDAMVLALIQRGVPTARIHTHTAGSRTWASVKHCATRPSTGPVVFVSQAFHLPRAVWLARRLGVTAYGYCAPSPPPRSVKHLRMHLREVASRTRAVADVAVHPHAAPLVR